MQTFLPLPDLLESVKCLDYKRLGKQRVEAMQILNTIEGRSSGWSNHPAVLMWKGYEKALSLYLKLTIEEWMLRGYKNTMKIPYFESIWGIDMPSWFGDEKFHASHRSNLLRKDKKHYSQFGWNELDNLPYVWPIKKGESNE